jgi:hypothetical protein
MASSGTSNSQSVTGIVYLSVKVFDCTIDEVTT